MNTQQWTLKIDSITNEFKNLFGNLTDQQINWKPDEHIWSIAQNIDHLIVTNQSYFPIIHGVRKGTYKIPFIGKINFLVNLCGKIIFKAVQPDRKRRMKTFSIWEPAKSNLSKDTLINFEKNQEELKKLIINSKDLLGRGKVISSPVNKYIIYKLETAFDIIVTHEQRHLVQAKEVLERMNESR